MPDDGGRIDNVIDLKKEDKKRVSPEAKGKKLSCPTRLVVDYPEIFNSPAWLSLTGIAPQLYILFLLRRRSTKMGKKGHQKNVITNGRELEFTYRDANEKYGITERRFHKAIDELVNKGLLDIVESGHGLYKQKTKYGISERWRKYGTSDFEEVPRPKGNHIGRRGWNVKKAQRENL